MIIYRRMTKDQAAAFVAGIDNLTDAAFEELVTEWRNYKINDFEPSYSELRVDIIDTYRRYASENVYRIDLEVGLSLYEGLSVDSGFNNILANDDDVWRYISCMVFPDITYMRYPAPAKEDIRINRKRFYTHTRRIWLKTLWWYVHLSWQGNRKATYDVLRDFGTDTISDFIERPGQGYRLSLYRELMKGYAGVSNKSADLFNRIQKQNLVNCRIIEPALTKNGEPGYVRNLFDQLEIPRNEPV